MLRKVILCWLLWHCCSSGQAQDETCQTQGQPGTCKTVYQCEAAINSIKADGFHKLTRCGFRGMSEIVCCVEGKEEDTFGDRFAQDDLQVSTATRKPLRPINARQPMTSTTQFVTRTTQFVTTTTEKPKRKAELECDKIVQAFNPALESYILNGLEVALGDFPYMAAIGYRRSVSDEDEDKKISYLCGGTLISERFVLSAGHCLDAKKLRDRTPSTVKLGTVNLKDNSSESEYEIAATIVHPHYNSRNISNDIGLVKLAKSVTFTDTLHPGCLFTKPEVPARVPLVVIGFGVTNYTTRQFSTMLLKATLSLVPNKQCKEHYEDVRNYQIRDNMLCAGDNEGKDACQGDSGGPLQALTEKDGHYRIIGITSFGKHCGTKSPGVYTRVSSHIDWIESVVWPDENISNNI